MNIGATSTHPAHCQTFDTSLLIQLLTSLRDDGPDAAVLDPILVDDVVDIDESSQLK